MFRKYDKTYHLFPVTSKFNLDDTTIKRLLAGPVIVEEKLDGSNVAIIGHPTGFKLQKRGSLVGAAGHPQFDALNNWAWSKCDLLNTIPKHTWVYGEWLYAKHTIKYTQLLDLFIVFDVYSEGKWLNREQKEAFCNKFNFQCVPMITQGTFTKDALIELIPKHSTFGPEVEGIVIKRYSKNGYFRAKIVRSEFIKKHEDNENWNQFNIEKNELCPR